MDAVVTACALARRAMPRAWALVMVSGLMIAGCSGSTVATGSTAATVSPAVTGSPVPASAISRLTALASRTATDNGDSTPSWVTAVFTTRAKALTSASPDEYIPGSGHVLVFLVTMKGRFMDTDSFGPPGSAVPTGRYLSLVVDAKTFRVLDYGLSGKPPRVSPASLGPVTVLRVRGG
jgi:hypothetical protein